MNRALDGTAGLQHAPLVGGGAGVAVFGGHAQALVGEITEVFLDRAQPFDDGVGVKHPVPPVVTPVHRRAAPRDGER